MTRLILLIRAMFSRSDCDDICVNWPEPEGDTPMTNPTGDALKASAAQLRVENVAKALAGAAWKRLNAGDTNFAKMKYPDGISQYMQEQWPLYENDAREALDALKASAAQRKWTQADAERENAVFSEWFTGREYPNYPQHYPLTTEDAMHAAWQEAAKRAYLSPAAQAVDLRDRIMQAIFDPGATEGYKADRDLTTWQTDAVMRALSVEQAPQPFAWYWFDQHGCLYITGDDRRPDILQGAKPLYEARTPTEAPPVESQAAEIARLREALRDVRGSVKNARGAVESNQVADKDVHGTLTRAIAKIDAALAAEQK